MLLKKTTVNSEIFARVLFSRNFAYAKFRENKTSRNAEITLSFADICKSCPSREFLASQMCLLTLFAKIKFSRKFPDLQYFWRMIEVGALCFSPNARLTTPRINFCTDKKSLTYPYSLATCENAVASRMQGTK